MATVTLVLDFVKNHWDLICFAVFILIQILQRTTKHFSEHKGLVKVLLYIIDILSIFPSKEESLKLKLPAKPSTSPAKPDIK